MPGSCKCHYVTFVYSFTKCFSIAVSDSCVPDLAFSTSCTFATNLYNNLVSLVF